MADDNSEQLARIEQLERINALEAKNAGNLPENADWVDKAQYYGGKVYDAARAKHPLFAAVTSEPAKAVQHAVGKVLNYPAGVVTTALSQAIGAMKSGPNPVGMNDWVKTGLGQAPGLGDQFEKLGINSPTDGFDIPGTNGKKLSAKAIENVLGGFVLNPLSYNKFNQFAGKKLYNSAIQPIEVEGQRFNKNEVGDELFKAGVKNPLNIPAKIQPVVDAQMAKAAEMETAASGAGGRIDPKKALEAAQNYVDTLRKTARAGTDQEKLVNAMQADIDSHFTGKPATPVFTPKAPEVGYDAPTMGKIDRAGTMDPVVPNKFSQTGQNQKGISGVRPVINEGVLPPVVPKEMTPFDSPKAAYDYTPPSPESTLEKLKLAMKKNQAPPMLAADATPAERAAHAAQYPPGPGSPIDSPVGLPQMGEHSMAPEIPEADASMGAAWKKQAYGEAGSYDPIKRSDAWQVFSKLKGAGLKAETEAAVGRGSGAAAERSYAENNASTGKLLSTGKAQRKVSEMAGREFDRATDVLPTNTEGMVGMAGSKNGLEMLLKAYGIKGIRAARLMKMPVGYGLRAADPLMMKSAVGSSDVLEQKNPWLIKGDPNGEK